MSLKVGWPLNPGQKLISTRKKLNIAQTAPGWAGDISAWPRKAGAWPKRSWA